MKIISGGQSGVDRAALDAAIALGLDYGGWCPKGGWAEDLPDPPGLLSRYANLRETPSADPAERTLWNVRDSDATVVVVDGRGTAVSAGTELALALAARFGRPAIVLDVADSDSERMLREWLFVVSPAALGIGGPREREAPGIYNKALRFLAAALAGE
jgi:hypothetical protein